MKLLKFSRVIAVFHHEASGFGEKMARIYVTADEIKKYIFYIVLFNAIFPKVLEKSDLVIWVEDPENYGDVNCLSYSNFIDKYDHYGLNCIAK